MATLSIVNAGSDDVLIDGYIKARALSTTTLTKNPLDIPKMTLLQAALNAGTLSYSIAYTTAEKAAGLLLSNDTVQPSDMQPVTLTDAANNDSLANNCFIIQRTLASGGVTGTADDVVIFAAGSVPTKLGPKIRILDAWAYFSVAGAGGSTMSVRTAAAGGGSALTTISTAATGPARVAAAITASNLCTVATEGLIVRRSDWSAVGKIFLLCSREV